MGKFGRTGVCDNRDVNDGVCGSPRRHANSLRPRDFRRCVRVSRDSLAGVCATRDGSGGRFRYGVANAADFLGS